MSSVCPKCRDVLALGARACACGWRQTPKSAPEAPSRVFVPCAKHECVACAIAKVKTSNGWANFCLTHYEDYYSRIAKDFCAKQELDTAEKQRVYYRDKALREPLLGTYKLPAYEPPSIPRPRQPGDDDEPILPTEKGDTHGHANRNHVEA